MADERRRWWRCAAIGVAVVLAAVGVTFAVVSVHQRDHDQRQLHGALVERRAARTSEANTANDLMRTRQAVAAIVDRLTAIPAAATVVASLDDQDLELVRAAVQAGLAGSVSDYNKAVDQRNALDARHDATLEQLRVEINSQLTALDALKG
jgi:hypothetical protein